jgi:hypothetical protein
MDDDGERFELVRRRVEALAAGRVKFPSMAWAHQYAIDYLPVRKGPLGMRTAIMKCPDVVAGSYNNDGRSAASQANRHF